MGDLHTTSRPVRGPHPFAERAPGYGIDGVLVDGNDLFAVNAVMQEAVRRARAGDGPTLIESLTWRAGAHNTADDPTRYVTADDEAPWTGTDPIQRVETFLAARGVWTEEPPHGFRLRCTTEAERALGIARQTPLAVTPRSSITSTRSRSDRLNEQRAQWACTYGDD